MESLFRFALIRPPVSTDADAPGIQLAYNTPFQQQLAQAQQTSSSREAVKTIVRAFVASPAFKKKPDALLSSASLDRLASQLALLVRSTDISHEAVVSAIETAFDQPMGALRTSQNLTRDRQTLADSIIAIKLLPEAQVHPIGPLTSRLRLLELIARTATDPAFPEDARQLRRMMRRPLEMPVRFELRPILSTAVERERLAGQQADAMKREEEARRQKLDRYRQLKSAIAELSRAGPDLIESTVSQAHEGHLVPEAYRPEQVFIKDMQLYQQLSDLNLKRIQSSVSRPTENTRSSPDLIVDLEAGRQSVTSLFSHDTLFKAGTTSFKPAGMATSRFCLKTSAERQLSDGTREVLKKHGIGLQEQPLDQLIDTLQREKSLLSRELDFLYGSPIRQSFRRIGNTLIRSMSPLKTAWDLEKLGIEATAPIFSPFDNRIPHTHGSVAPAGVADLMVVKQQLIGYEGMDVAHIENVLRGEKKEREHIRHDVTEKTQLTEAEMTLTEERELTSTSRFEMSREVQETLKEDSSLKGGLQVSAKYGDFLEVSTSLEGEQNQSKEKAIQTATHFSQDVTERSAQKVNNRFLERTTLKVTNEITEKNLHLLDNVNGSGHIAGVYQWVDKVYQARMYNYGLRAIYDFMIPEPAAYLVAALEKAHAGAIALEEPMPFDITPDQISEENYCELAHRYGATSVTAPPELFRTKSDAWKDGGGNKHTHYQYATKIDIDEGYEAVYGNVTAGALVFNDTFAIETALGSHMFRFHKDTYGIWGVALDHERDSVPFALVTDEIANVSVAVEVTCQRTERAMMNWRLETHAKIQDAYQARKMAYEEKLAKLQIQAGIEIQGRNPGWNLELMKDEIKKNCVSILTDQHFNRFDSIEKGTDGMPQIDLHENEAEGPYVRFFEQAFEWEQMTWLTYPYFWGRKGRWEDMITYEDTDPLFNQFLKAGYCRVSVPARPGFEGAIDHFMNHGELWMGGSLPAISSPLYLPIADELAERLDRPGEEIPEGEPWTFRLPTTLVHLRADDRLPAWVQNEDGRWVEVEP